MSAGTVMDSPYCVTSWIFKSTSKDDLKELVISVNGRDKPETPHGKVSDSVVDRLLLRYLSCRLSLVRFKKQFSLTW